MTTLVATTRARDLQSLGAAGQSIGSAWAVLHPLLRQRLGAEHAALLAEPMVNPAQGEIDWYAGSDQPVRPIASLAPGERRVVEETLARLAGDIAALTATLKASRDAGERTLGALLDLALQVPGDGFVYADGQQPVLVAWGHARAGAGSVRVALAGERRTAVRPMAILHPPGPPVAVRRGLGAAVATATACALVLLAATLYLIGRDPMGWYARTEAACAVPTDDMALHARLDAAAGREPELRLQLARLTTDAGARRLMCPPVRLAAVAAPPPPAPLLPRPRSEDESRAERRGAQRGKLTIILAWDDRNDLDLSVVCPGGDRLFFNHRQACGGVLDVDANESVRTADVQPVENIFFAQPAPGEYYVTVDPYAMRVATETPFRVTIQQDGRPDRIINGIARNGVRGQDVATVVVEGAP